MSFWVLSDFELGVGGKIVKYESPPQYTKHALMVVIKYNQK